MNVDVDSGAAAKKGSAADAPLPLSRIEAAILPCSAFVYGAWAAAGLVLPDDYTDSPAERVTAAIVGIFVAMALEIRRSSPEVRRRATAVYAFVVYAHWVTLFLRADGSELYALGTLIVFAGASLLFHSIGVFLAFTVYVIALTLASRAVIEIPHGRFMMLILGVGTIAAVTSIMMYLRLRYIEAYHEQRLRSVQSESRALEQQLEVADETITRYRLEAQIDPLTGLPNRRMFLDQLDRACDLARRRGEPIGVLYADLDGFKAVNDLHGHDVGDQVLIRFGTHLVRSLRKSDVAARLAGDEFVAILHDLRSLDDADPVCDRILAIARTPLHLPGPVTTRIGVSLGVVYISGDHGDPARRLTPSELLLQADRAMYDAKRDGKGRWVGRDLSALPAE